MTPDEKKMNNVNEAVDDAELENAAGGMGNERPAKLAQNGMGFIGKVKPSADDEQIIGNAEGLIPIPY